MVTFPEKREAKIVKGLELCKGAKMFVFAVPEDRHSDRNHRRARETIVLSIPEQIRRSIQIIYAVVSVPLSIEIA
jgi:hypothetical protein